MIILDSDVLITIIDKKDRLGDRLIQLLKANYEETVTTAINLEEVLFGIYKRTKKEEGEKINKLLKLTAIPFTKEDAIIAAKLETEMEARGTKKPRGDILIAAIAIRVKGKLMTLNTRHFKDIPELELMEIREQTT